MYCTRCGVQLRAESDKFCSECGQATALGGQSQTSGYQSAGYQSSGYQPYGEGRYAPRRLYRSATDKKIAGVCGGLAKYLDVDPTLIRVLLLVSLFCGVGFLAYIIAMIVIPMEPRDYSTASTVADARS